MRRASKTMAWGGMVKPPSICQPETEDELSKILESATTVRTLGYWNRNANSQTADSQLDLSKLSGIVDFSPSDQVVKIRSGTTIGELKSDLKNAGQTIPIFVSNEGEPWGFWDSLLVADCLGWNLPHGLEGQHGTWRDWVLGATVVMANGMIFKSGSSVVKSVAGYDVHRLMLGARHTLGVVAEVTLRTTPISTLKTSEIEIKTRVEETALTTWRIQRCMKSRIHEMRDEVADSIVAIDPLSCTAFFVATGNEPLRFDSDWILETGRPSFQLKSAQAKYMMRAKQIFDPTGKLNSGEMGIF